MGLAVLDQTSITCHTLPKQWSKPNDSEKGDPTHCWVSTRGWNKYFLRGLLVYSLKFQVVCSLCKHTNSAFVEPECVWLLLFFHYPNGEESL